MMDVETLQVTRFASDGSAIAAQEAYIALLDGTLETEFIEPLAMSGAVYRIGTLLAIRMTATPRLSRRSAAQIARDQIDALHVQYVVAGRAEGVAGTRPVDSLPGTVMLLDYRQPFTIVDREARTVFDVTLPRHLVGTGDVDPAALHGCVLQGGEAAPLIAVMRVLDDAGAVLPTAAGPALERALIALLATAIGDHGGFAGTIGPRARTIARAERWIDYKLGSPQIGPAWLADKLKLSRSELYAALEPFGGVARFIQGRRLRAARMALADADDTRRIGEIALALGFASEAHFSRSFKSAFGTPPSAWRAASRVMPPTGEE